MVEHRKHCPSCNGMRTFRGDFGSFNASDYTVLVNCADCGYAMAVSVPRWEVEPQVSIYPRC
jgi:hypothetical protein